MFQARSNFGSNRCFGYVLPWFLEIYSKVFNRVTLQVLSQKGLTEDFGGAKVVVQLNTDSHITFGWKDNKVNKQSNNQFT